MTRKRPKDYISNKELLNHIKDWYATDNPEPPLVLVKGIIQISENLGTKSNFNGYSYIDEMVSAAIEKCFVALKCRKFNVERSDNPFAYFTTIAFNEFRKVLNIEKKETYIKHKEYQDFIHTMSLMGVSVDLDNNDGSGKLENLIEKFEGKENDTTESGTSNSREHKRASPFNSKRKRSSPTE